MILQVHSTGTLNEDRAGDILVHLLGDGALPGPDLLPVFWGI